MVYQATIIEPTNDYQTSYIPTYIIFHLVFYNKKELNSISACELKISNNFPQYPIKFIVKNEEEYSIGIKSKFEGFGKREKKTRLVDR